jgi:glycine cleavage system H protein
MAHGTPDPIHYRRERFETPLPADRRYSPSHFWLQPEASGAWRVGFTPFAVRLLGEMVEFAITAPAGSPLRVGQVVGWVEGFKAVTELYGLVDGELVGGNPDLEREVALIQSDPFGRGWLYRATGTPAADCTDAAGYAGVLDRTIDRMAAPPAPEGDGGAEACRD